MRKLAILPIALIALFGIVFASGVLFPDTVSLPRFPGGPGTMSGVFSMFRSDGTAQNALSLSGVSATGYLQNTDCSSEPINKVWVGIDADGKGICGPTTRVMALLGTISDFSGTVQVQHTGSTIWETVTLGTPIMEGDLVSTNMSSIASITFTDLSIIRLNTDTIVEISVGTNTSGDAIAQVILDNGELWGRVLTSTGINFGNKDWIAGVRGTSLNVQYNKLLATGSINIVDSTNNSSAAIMIARNNPNIMWDRSSGSSFSIYALSPDEIGTDSTLVTASLVTRGKSNIDKSLSLDTEWIRENTKKDIAYLSVLADSGAILPGVFKTKIDNEFKVSIPKNIDECNKIFQGAAAMIVNNTNIIQSEVLSVNSGLDNGVTLNPSDYCSDIISSITDEKKKNTVVCALGNKIYWKGGLSEDCQDTNVIAVADYTQLTTYLYFNKGELSIQPLYEKRLMDSSGDPVSQIKDDGYFAGKKCDDGTLKPNGAPNTSYNTVPDESKFGIIRGKNIYIPRPEGSTICQQKNSNFGGNDMFMYDYYSAGGIWDRTMPMTRSGVTTIVMPQPITTSSEKGVSITGSGYISYPLSLFPMQTGGTSGPLSGKRITLTVTGSTTNGKYIVDFGNSNYIRKAGSGYQCSWGCTPDLSGNTITIIAPNNIKYFVLGNNLEQIGSLPGTPPLNMAAEGITFQKIQISNPSF